MKHEGIRKEEDGGNSIGIDNEYERAHPICYGRFRQNRQSYCASFHGNHHCEGTASHITALVTTISFTFSFVRARIFLADYGIPCFYGKEFIKQ